MSELLLHIPDFLLAVLSCWLGLSLLVRSPQDRVSRAFAWFCLPLALYGLTALLPQLTADPSVAQGLNRGQLMATVLSPVAFLHFIAILTSTGPLSRQRWLALGMFYLTGIALSIYALAGPLPPPLQGLRWSRWGELRFPDGPLSWAWAAQRTLPLLLALAMMWTLYRSPNNGVYSRQLRRMLAITTFIGVVGALAATAARSIAMLPGLPDRLVVLAAPALPRTIILLAMVALAYAVLAHRALLPARTARRTFFYSMLGSIITTLYVGILLGLEWLAGNWLQINAPVVSVLALVVMVAALGPVREWFRDQLDQRFYRREFDYGRLLRRLSDDLFEQGDLTDQLQSALMAICQALGVRAGLVAVKMQDGLVVQALYGDEPMTPALPEVALPAEARELEDGWSAWPAARLLFPVRRGDEDLALLALGARRSGLPFTQTEQALLDHLSGYLGLAISHARARDTQQAAIATLAEQSQALREQQEQLAQQATAAVLAAAARPEPEPAGDGKGLRVYALGSLRVEREGEPITRWGGDKAGTYQAEALFAFLFDRRGKGVTKDEVEEVIWPDLDISKADAAFHRTLAALRRTLEPGLRRGNESRTILYHHERYWLEPESIAWCDNEAFNVAAERGITRYHQGDRDGALAALERAGELYRGDYMDDCPFFGDSTYVEEQREVLRSRYVELQLTLGGLYEALGRIGEAASAYRRALAASPNGCPPATTALSRLNSDTVAR